MAGGGGNSTACCFSFMLKEKILVSFSTVSLSYTWIFSISPFFFLMIQCGIYCSIPSASPLLLIENMAQTNLCGQIWKLGWEASWEYQGITGWGEVGGEVAVVVSRAESSCQPGAGGVPQGGVLLNTIVWCLGKEQSTPSVICWCCSVEGSSCYGVRRTMPPGGQQREMPRPALGGTRYTTSLCTGSCWAGKQKNRNGPGSAGGHQGEHKPPVCPHGKECKEPPELHHHQAEGSGPSSAQLVWAMGPALGSQSRDRHIL